jgi:hypothetical protein
MIITVRDSDLDDAVERIKQLRRDEPKLSPGPVTARVIDPHNEAIRVAMVHDDVKHTYTITAPRYIAKPREAFR